jgi:dimethylaniline monooxygenase (N-oxide forming)
MGAAPSILEVLAFGRVVFLTWALGPNFNTKFRLVGPWRWDGAAAIMEGELWKVIKRRKGFISKFASFR